MRDEHELAVDFTQTYSVAPTGPVIVTDRFLNPVLSGEGSYVRFGCGCEVTMCDGQWPNDWTCEHGNQFRR